MRIKIAVPDGAVTKDVIDAALEASTRANDVLLARGERPTSKTLLDAGCKWKPEPYMDGEHFDLAPVIGKRGWGDCDDWASVTASDARVAGYPHARAVVRRVAPGRWHAVVEPNGDPSVTWDPSEWAGMKSSRRKSAVIQGVAAPLVRPTCAPGKCGIVAMPRGKQWAARVDLPWGGSGPVHFASIAQAPTVQGAIDDALYGAMAMGEGIASPDLANVHRVGFDLGGLLGTAGGLGGMALGGPLGGMAGSALGGALGGLFGGGGGGGGGGAPAPAPAPPQPGLPPGMMTAPMPGGLGSVFWHPSHTGAPIIVRF